MAMYAWIAITVWRPGDVEVGMGVWVDTLGDPPDPADVPT